MKRAFMVLITGTIAVLSMLNVLSSCPGGDPLDPGSCDTLHAYSWEPTLGSFPKNVHLSFLVSNDLTVAAFVVPLEWHSTNPGANCALPESLNTTSLTDMDGSIFRDFGGMTNRMRQLAWQARIIEISHDFVGFAMIPSGPGDPPWDPGHRTLLATLTFTVDDTTTICVDSTFWWPTARLAFSREDAYAYVPRHNLPFCFPVCQCGDLGFRPNPDGWGFDNIEVNMWPEEWWLQLDYCHEIPAGWYRTKCEQNPSHFPDWPLFVSVFGEDQCYNQPVTGDIEPVPYAIMKYFGIRNIWRGSCFGFATSSLLFFDDHLNVNDEFGVPELYDVEINPASRLMINKYFLYQFGVNHTRHSKARQHSTTPNQTLQECREMFNDSERSDRILILCANCGPGTYGGGELLGHGVVPYRCEVDSADTQVTHVYAYDPDRLGDSTYRVSINRTTDTWSGGGLPGPARSHGLFLMEPVSHYTTRPELGDFPTSLQAVSSRKIRPDQHDIEFYFSPTDIAIFHSPAGSIGHIGDSVFNTLGDGIPIIPIAGDETTPIGYYVPALAYTCEFTGAADSVFSVAVFTGSTALSYRRWAVETTQTDVLRHPGNDSTLLVLNPEIDDRIYDLEAICVAPDSQVYYSVQDVSVDYGDSARYSIRPLSQLQLDNYGQVKTYDLRLQIVGINGNAVFFHEEIPLGENSSHLIVPDWRPYNDSLMILVDSGMVGTFSDTIFVDNEGEYILGDANRDGIINVGDVVYLVAYLYKGGPAPNPTESGDCNCDGIVNVGDVVYLVSYLYKGGPVPSCK